MGDELQPIYSDGRIKGIVRRDSLASENVVLSSPMSFTGSLLRIWRLTEIETENPWARAGLIASAVVLTAAAWIVIFCWYSMALFVWPLLLIVRLMGRHQRKEKADQLRHREVIEALGNGKL